MMWTMMYKVSSLPGLLLASVLALTLNLSQNEVGLGDLPGVVSSCVRMVLWWARHEAVVKHKDIAYSFKYR